MADPGCLFVLSRFPMNRSSATRILVLVSLSCLSNSNQPKRSCAFFIGIRLPARRPRFRINRTRPYRSAGSCENRDSFERARLSGCEHDGKLLHESFPLADDGVPSASSSVNFVVTFLLFQAAMWRSSPAPKMPLIPPEQATRPTWPACNGVRAFLRLRLAPGQEFSPPAGTPATSGSGPPTRRAAAL